MTFRSETRKDALVQTLFQYLCQQYDDDTAATDAVVVTGGATTATTDAMVVTGGSHNCDYDHNGESRDGERSPASEVQVGANTRGTHDVTTKSTRA